MDVLRRAVRRMFEGEGEEPAAAPNVAVINLSIGIRDRPFDQALSPLARLLDWLAWRYKVLFVVSAGNHAQRIGLPSQAEEGSSTFADGMQGAVIRSITSDGRNRRLLSPAEAVNGLTVGAVHKDASTGTPPPRWRDPYHGTELPSPINSTGNGISTGDQAGSTHQVGAVLCCRSRCNRRRACSRVWMSTAERWRLDSSSRHPGATAGGQAGARHARGTSNAAAVISRAAGSLYEVLDELRGDPGGEMIDGVPRAVWLKALVTHGADWNTAGDTLGAILDGQGNSRQIKAYVTRLLGYGAIEIDRVRECTESRVTAISAGSVEEESSHVHRFPLPPSLNGWRGYRRLTITLAWISPVNPRHRNWRRAQLWFSPPTRELSVGRTQADWQTVQRGTLQHEILEGESSGEFVQGANLEIQVSCRADAGALEERIPYALVTTIEVASDLWVSNIYDEVRTAVQSAHVHVATAHGGIP